MTNLVVIGVLVACVITSGLVLLQLCKLRRAIATGAEATATTISHGFSTVSKEISDCRTEVGNSASNTRREISDSIKGLSDSLQTRLSEFSNSQETKFTAFSTSLDNQTKAMETKLDSVRDKVDEKLDAIRKDNNAKLDEMRITVDEKLHDSLEKRLGESFKQVSDRLEQVHKGLGEMQTLANDVGGLKRILVNVRTRGTVGEVQLEAILEQMLSPNLFSKNVQVDKNSSERVEFAIHLPGADGNGQPLLLPIDAKFPTEDYERLMQAYEDADPKAVKDTQRQFERRLKDEAKKIATKYIRPPVTTPYAIMFLPTEGLFAEAIRIPGLIDYISQENNIHIAGPTTISVLIASLLIGFRTVAVEQKSVEVWETLGAVKTEFSKFGIVLDKAQKKIETAGNSVHEVARKSRTIERKLRKVEELPPVEAARLLETKDGEPDED